MNTKQEEALREWLQEAIVPLIEQLLVKKLGQAMSYAASELIQPQRTWVGLTDKEAHELWESTDSNDDWELMKRTEAKLKEKNT